MEQPCSAQTSRIMFLIHSVCTKNGDFPRDCPKMSNAVPCCRIPKHSLVLLGVISSPQKPVWLGILPVPGAHQHRREAADISSPEEMGPGMGSYHQHPFQQSCLQQVLPSRTWGEAVASQELEFGVAGVSASREGTDVPCASCTRFCLSFLLLCVVSLLLMLSWLLQSRYELRGWHAAQQRGESQH